MCEQLDIFSLIAKRESENAFNPIEEFAKRGSGFAGGKKRIVDFFQRHPTLERWLSF